jgi:hypothetical protein
VDFASAGATGREYQSWLPTANARPPRPAARSPADGAKIGRGSATFSWRKPAGSEVADSRYSIAISDSPRCERVLVSVDGQNDGSAVVPAAEIRKLPPNTTYCWKIIARNSHGQSESIAPYKRLTIEDQ